MNRSVVSTEGAPAAVGPYSQGIVAGGFVFTAGQIGLIPGTKDLAGGGIAGQTERALENLKAVLEAAGSSLDRVVKTTVYLREMSDFAVMNEVYARYFGESAPARATAAAGELPLGALVEIDAVAAVG
jgi:2-iminobutanoate/2-iminopropanoate deaminase